MNANALKFVAYLLLGFSFMIGLVLFVVAAGTLVIAYPEAQNHSKVILVALGILLVAAAVWAAGYVAYSALKAKAQKTDSQSNL